MSGEVNTCRVHRGIKWETQREIDLRLVTVKVNTRFLLKVSAVSGEVHQSGVAEEEEKH